MIRKRKILEYFSEPHYEIVFTSKEPNRILKDKYEIALKEKDENIGKLDTRSKEEAAKFGDLLKEKNSEITDLGARLESASKKIAGLNKKIAKLESKDLACENKLDELQTNLDKA